MCTVNRKTEQEDRMTRRLRGKCFFVTISKNERGKQPRGKEGGGIRDEKKNGGYGAAKCGERQAGEKKQSRTGAEGERKMRVGKNSRKDERGRRNVRIMPAAVEKMRPQRKRKTEVPGKQ